MTELTSTDVAARLGISLGTLHCARTGQNRYAPVAQAAHRVHGRLRWSLIDLEAVLLEHPELLRRNETGRPRKASSA